MHEASVERIAIIRNPRSGTAPETAKLEQALCEAGVTAGILDAPEGAAFLPWLDRVATSADTLVAAGGDGTVNAVATVAAKHRRTLAILPTGTLNHFARDNGIPTDMAAAMELIRTGRQQCVDVGLVNGHLFLNNVSLGNYPRMVQERSGLQRRGLPKRVAGAIAAFDTWWHLRSMAAALTLDRIDMVRRSPFIVIANGSYVLSGFDLGKREEISDGRLSVYVAPHSGRLGALSWPLRALIGTLERHAQFETLSASTVEASLRSPRIAVAIDGEVRELATPLEFVIRRHALRVLVPREATP